LGIFIVLVVVALVVTAPTATTTTRTNNKLAPYFHMAKNPLLIHAKKFAETL
jgi:hypothetical protein